MHYIKINQKNLRTDLILEQKNNIREESKYQENNIIVTNSRDNNYNYTTIYYKDITDKDNFLNTQKVLIRELKKYINTKKEDKILVIGLGNNKSTPDSLGPNTVENILVTSHLFLLGDVEEGYSNVSSFIPNVMGNTGIETAKIIKSIIKDTKANKVIVIDSLKTSNIKRLLKTIQITNRGISPGSGIGNNRKEISKKTTGIDIIAIGIPTVVDINSIINNYTNKRIKEIDNLIVTPTNIDYMIDKLSILIGNGINSSLHKNFIRQEK